MSFKRARTQDQKDQRLEEIIKVACKLYTSTSYDKLSMASIAKELSFSRVSLYSYASTKEEIFLLVLIEDHRKWVEDINKALRGKEEMAIEDFASIWATIYYKHQRLLSLYSIMWNIIEKNVSLDKLVQFKKDFVASAMLMTDTVIRALPFLTEESFYKFNQLQFHFLVGLYPATQDNELQKEAIIQSGIPYQTPDFIEVVTDFIEILLLSMKSKT